MSSGLPLPFVQTPRARAVDLRTYCRPLDDQGSAFESREQMVRRAYVEHHRQLYKANNRKPDTAEIAALERLALEGKSALAGRTQWLGGTPYAQERACTQYNCAFAIIDSVYSLTDTAWLLLNGCGVGFTPRAGVLHGYTRPIPELVVVPSEQPATHKGPDANVEVLPDEANGYTWTIHVGDSAAAWAKAGGKLFATRNAAKRLVLDFSNVRGPGGRLKGYGWICNGYKPLADAFTFFHTLLNRFAGNLLDEIAILDVVNAWGCVLSSRRAAELCQLDEHNPRIREFERAKYRYWETNPHRRQSNNTIAFWSKPSRARIEEVLRNADECGGCPGLLNASAALEKSAYFAGLNPCFAPETLVVTRQGPRRIDSLVGQTVDIFDGTQWRTIDNFRVTATNAPVLAITLYDGSVLRVTPYHTMVKANGEKISAQGLRVGDTLRLVSVPTDGPIRARAAYLKGFLVGDGSIHRQRRTTQPELRVYQPKYMCLERLVASANEIEPAMPCKTSAKVNVDFRDNTTAHRSPRRHMRGLASRAQELLPWTTSAKHQLPDEAFQWDRHSKCEFIAGLFDADGTALDSSHGFGYQLTSVSLSFLRSTQTLLKTLGVKSRIAKGKDGGVAPPSLPRATTEKPYVCQPTWRLLVNQRNAITLSQLVRFERLTSFANRHTKYNTRDRSGEIISIDSDGVEPFVYCCTVPDTHTVLTATNVLTGQCAETLLANRSVCNVVTNCLPRFHRNFAALERAIYTIARANYRQACVDMRDGVLSPEWHQTNEALRLCGVSLTGIVQADWLTDNQIRRMRNAAIAGAYSMADEWKLERPKAVTLGKPEGTQSKTLGGTDVGEIAEGINRPLGRFLFNWVNFSAYDPLVGLLESAGYRTLPNPSDPNNVLVCFPIEYNNIRFDVVDGKEVNLEPAIVQLERYLRWTTLWADHNMSCTISYSPHEIPLIAQWIDDHWDDGFIATSFLKRNDPTRTAKDLGHPYLPQEVTTEGPFREYVASLREVEWGKVTGIYDIDEQSCAGGVCPTK